MTSPAEKVKSLLRESVLDICLKQLTFYSHLEIRAQVEVIVDNHDSLSMYIDETVQSFGNTPKKSDAVGCNSVRNEESLLQGDASDAKACSNAMQLIKQEAENSSTGKSWPVNHTKDPKSCISIRSVCPEIGPIEQRQAEQQRRTDGGHLTDNQVQDKVQNGNIVMMHLSPTCELAERATELNEMEPPKDNFSSPDDPKSATTFNPGYVQDEPGPELTTENSHQNSSAAEHTYFHKEEVELLPASLQLPKRNGLYKCPQCEFLTEHGSAMNAHIKAHEKTVPCSHCREMFSSVTVLKQHVYDEHGISCRRKVKCLGNEFGCQYCGEKYKTVDELSNHLADEHHQVSGACPYCSYIAVHAGSLRRHVRKHCIVGKWKCKLCDFLCGDKHRLRLHMEQEHATDGCVMCELCGVSVKGPLMLRLHVKTVHDQHRCIGCSFSSPRLETLEKHRCTDDKDKLCCKICLSTDFVCITQLKKHMRQQHPMDHKKKQCDFCDKVFCSRQGLYTHRKVVHGSEVDGSQREVFTCHICGKGFPIFKYLKGHLKSHEDSEPYKCPKCHKTFKYHRNFKTHKQGCFNPAGYPCPICHKTLKNEYSLKIHINGVHLNEKVEDRFPCRKCGMPFSRLPTRTSHEKVCTNGSISSGHV